MADDRRTAVKNADKGSSVVVWDRIDYTKEAEKELSDENIYRKVEFRKKIVIDLVKTSNRLFKNVKTKGCISDKNLKYFTYEFKKSANLGKLFLLPEIHKRLFEVPGRPVISDCGAATEKVSNFSDHHLKPIMQQGKCYMTGCEDFLLKIRKFTSILDGSFLVTADVVGLYPSIPHSVGLDALKSALGNRKEKQHLLAIYLK